MMFTVPKVFVFVILLSAILIFTGLLTTASAFIVENSEKSCCDECNGKDEGSSKPDHCSTPTCPMFLCLLVNIVSSFTLSELSGSIHISQFTEQLNIESPAKPIFHPPVIV